MKKIEFINGQEPALNATILNQLQTNIEQAIAVGGVAGDTLPIGSVVEFASDVNVPANWLLCNGQAVSRTEYDLLFTIIGTTWGEGDGSTTFNVPTKEGLVTVGKKSSDTDFNTIGKTGGEKTHTLTVDEMPEHNHAYNKTSGASTNKDTGSGTAYGDYQVNTSSAGGSQPHNNLQPYVTSNFIIKAKQSAGVVATVVDNLNSTSSTDALSARQGKILNEKISLIVESGSNENGSYIKWADGTMICRKTMSYTNIAINNAWGSLYESNSSLNIGNYAMPFINVPEISITPCNPLIIEKLGDATASSFGTFFAVKPKTAEETFTINCIAIGKWK